MITLTKLTVRITTDTTDKDDEYLTELSEEMANFLEDHLVEILYNFDKEKKNTGVWIDGYVD